MSFTCRARQRHHDEKIEHSGLQFFRDVMPAGSYQKGEHDRETARDQHVRGPLVHLDEHKAREYNNDCVNKIMFKQALPRIIEAGESCARHRGKAGHQDGEILETFDRPFLDKDGRPHEQRRDQQTKGQDA